MSFRQSWSPQFASTSSTFVHGPILQKHCEDEEELPVAPVVSWTESDVVETLIGILRDLQQLVVPGIDGAKERFHLQ